MQHEGHTPKKVLLVSIITPQTSDSEAARSLLELGRLVGTLDCLVVGRVTQRLGSSRGLTALGKGKLEELTQRITQSDPELRPQEVVFDLELTPSQVRNLEQELGLKVVDRTGVIIEIFSRHAKTRAAQLQVEIARLTYRAPKLRELGVGKEHHSGRGSGESGLELEKRKYRDHMAELRRELSMVQKEEESRRLQRSEQLVVALVGYTNAGKSSLMRALTGSEVLVEDKLFATLDTTVRALQPETQPRILITDTVGFIHNIPHPLVASFKSTLDETRSASLLLIVVDASDPDFRRQLDVVQKVLLEIKADSNPFFLVLNKVDCLELAARDGLFREFPTALWVSALDPSDAQKVRSKVIEFFDQQMQECEMVLPYAAQGLLGEMRSQIQVLKESFEQTGVRVLVRARDADLSRLRKALKHPRKNTQS